MCLMIIGVIAYSTAISSITSIMSASDRQQQELNKKLDVLTRIKQEYNIGFEFYWKLRQSLHYDHLMDKTEQQELISKLPPKLRV